LSITLLKIEPVNPPACITRDDKDKNDDLLLDGTAPFNKIPSERFEVPKKKYMLTKQNENNNILLENDKPRTVAASKILEAI
jgi:hypothetical protein